MTKLRRARVVWKTKSIAAPKRRELQSRSRARCRPFDVAQDRPCERKNKYGKTTSRAGSGNPISFLARSSARRNARTDRRFLGILSRETERARVCPAADRRNG